MIYVLADLFYYVYERPVRSFSHDFVVFNVLRICFFVQYQWPHQWRRPRSSQYSRWIVFSISFVLFLLYTGPKNLHALKIYRVLIKVTVLTITLIMVIGLSGVCYHTSDKQNRTTAKRESDLLITTDWIGQHDAPLPINNNNCNLPQK